MTSVPWEYMARGTIIGSSTLNMLDKLCLESRAQTWTRLSQVLVSIHIVSEAS